MTIRLPVLAVAVMAAPLVAFAQPATCPGFFTGGQPPVLVNAKLMPRTTLLCNDAYAALASGVTHGPIWSAERLTAASVAAARRIPRQGRFHADRRLPPGDRAQLDDYRNSGFDRGGSVANLPLRRVRVLAGCAVATMRLGVRAVR